MGQHIGKQSCKFNKKISIKMTASVAGPKEGEGPLKGYFDLKLADSLLGEISWEKAESKIVKSVVEILLKKANIKEEDVDYIFSGDLLNQTCGSSFGIRGLNIPYFGIFGACSTMGEGMCLGAITIESGVASNVIHCASSHFCSAEKQFRFPLNMGTQRPLTSTWTVTGAGATLLSPNGEAPYILGMTTGKITDLGIKDANNMGAAMAPSAADVIVANFKDFNIQPEYYDKIITGDLGYVGKELLIELVKKEGYDISKVHMDCGIEIFDRETQDTHSGGSGCACAGITFSGMIYDKLKKGKFKRILFIPTGALLSTTSLQQKETIPGIAHGVIIGDSL